MSNLTFKTFLRIVEDAQQDIQKLMADITAIDAQIAQRTGPLIARKMQLTKQLQAKQKQAASTANTPEKQGMVSNTTTPGGGGSGTPGSTQPM